MWDEKTILPVLSRQLGWLEHLGRPDARDPSKQHARVLVPGLCRHLEPPHHFLLASAHEPAVAMEHREPKPCLAAPDLSSSPDPVQGVLVSAGAVRVIEK